MPAILSAIFSAIYAALANKENYKDSLTDIFPAMNEMNSTMAMAHNGTSVIGVMECLLCMKIDLPQSKINFLA